MTGHHISKGAEVIIILIFAGFMGYLIVHGLLSATGHEHMWPYPKR